MNRLPQFVVPLLCGRENSIPPDGGTTNRWLVILIVLLALPALVVAQEQTPQIDSARDFLELLGISNSELEFFQSGTEFTADEYDSLNRMLNAIPRLPQRMVLRWKKSDVDWQAVLSNPDAYRSELLPVTGRLTSVLEVEVQPSVKERYGFDRYFESTIRLAAGKGTTIVLFTRSFPERLAEVARENLEAEFDERVRVAGLFLKSNEPTNVVYAVANSLAWYPDANSVVDVIPHQIELSNRGMNMGSLDTVTDRTPLRSKDRDAFYEMLAAVGRADPGALDKLAESVDAMQLLQRKPEDRGQFFTMRGTARRAILVQVDDAEIRERLGVSKYYEIEVFDAKANVRVRRNKSDETGVTFSSYPVVFCVHELPAGMQTGDFIHENIEVTGAYLKLWAYNSAYLNDSVSPGQKRPLQISPLLIGRTAKRISGTATSNPRLGWIVGFAFICTLVLLAMILAYTSRRDRKFRTEIRMLTADAKPADDQPEIMVE